MPSEKLVIRVYGDSYGMPRAHMRVPFDRTYSELISEKIRAHRKDSRDVYLYNRSQGGVDIAQLYKTFMMDCTYFGTRTEDIVVIHSGIVDCAPRPIPPWLRSQISKLPSKFRAPIIKFLHKNRPIILKTGLKWRRTSGKTFLSVYKKWLKQAASDFRKVYVLNIVPITDEIARHSPGFRESIQVYNRLICEAINYVGSNNICLMDVFEAVSAAPGGIEKYTGKDGYHLSLEGHHLLGELILKDWLDSQKKEK